MSNVLENKILSDFLKVVFFLSLAAINFSFFLPYYVLDQELVYRFQQPFFPLYYLILTTVSILMTLGLILIILKRRFPLIAVIFVIIVNLFILTERAWMPFVNQSIKSTPTIGSGLFIFHAAIFTQSCYLLYVYAKRKRNQSESQ